MITLTPYERETLREMLEHTTPDGTPLTPGGGWLIPTEQQKRMVQWIQQLPNGTSTADAIVRLRQELNLPIEQK